VKTFFGSRETYELDVPINQIYSDLSKKFEDMLDLISGPRFFYPMVRQSLNFQKGHVRQLDSTVKSLGDYQIPDGAQLLMMVKKTFQWSEELKPVTLEVRKFIDFFPSFRTKILLLMWWSKKIQEHQETVRLFLAISQ
jgi:hypothetical protein